jgi:hypothetical protein
VLPERGDQKKVLAIIEDERGIIFPGFDIYRGFPGLIS